MSLDSLVEAARNNDLQFLFVGGKGGVGKTTSSSAIAYLLATTNTQKRILLVSTDPAHSLGDAWRMTNENNNENNNDNNNTFSNTPTRVLSNLDVMEIDPQETMKEELNSWLTLAQDWEGRNGGDAQSPAGSSGMIDKVHSFHSWLSGIPGIDEASALSTAITHIESGAYDIIVFDTAPTGHTLKLLALPEILEQGIVQLQSWQSTMWGYWEMVKGFTSSSSSLFGNNNNNSNKVKEVMANKLQSYKEKIQKVAAMLQDPSKTRFIVVCIAEYLSICETQRLLQELKGHNVNCTNIIVNQLVIEKALSQSELIQLEQLAEQGQLNLNHTLLTKTIHACRVTTARKEIQQKYLTMLQNFEETQEIAMKMRMMGGGVGNSSSSSNSIVVEVPLLAEEVTGAAAIGRFANCLVTDQFTMILDDTTSTTPSDGGGTTMDDTTTTNNKGKGKDEPAKKRQRITTTTTATATATATTADSVAATAPIATNSSPNTILSEENTITSKAMQILEDPEIKAMIQANPKVKEAVEDVLQNPMNIMNYMADPELGPFLMKAIGKLNNMNNS